jgi:hypothetical protein
MAGTLSVRPGRARRHGSRTIRRARPTGPTRGRRRHRPIALRGSSSRVQAIACRVPHRLRMEPVAIRLLAVAVGATRVPAAAAGAVEAVAGGNKFPFVESSQFLPLGPVPIQRVAGPFFCWWVGIFQLVYIIFVIRSGTPGYRRRSHTPQRGRTPRPDRSPTPPTARRAALATQRKCGPLR